MGAAPPQPNGVHQRKIGAPVETQPHPSALRALITPATTLDEAVEGGLGRDFRHTEAGPRNGRNPQQFSPSGLFSGLRAVHPHFLAGFGSFVFRYAGRLVRG
jgi:hypothetical protein